MDRRVKAVLGVLIVLSVIGYLWTTISIVIYPYTVDYGEAPLMDQAQRILSGQPLYKSDLVDPPYVIANYPPTYPYIFAILHKLSGLPLLQTGRMISFIASLISAVLLACLVKSLTNNWLASLVTVALFLGHPYVFTWSGLARVDLLALMFCLAALYILLHHWWSWRWLFLASIFLLASIYTRQSYLLSGPLAATVWLWSQDRRRCVVFVAMLLIPCFGLFLGINLLTEGGFYFNIFQANLNRFDFGRLWMMGQKFMLIWPIILITTLLMVIIFIQKSFRRKSDNSFINTGLLAFTLGALGSTLTVGKLGSDLNYFLEIIAACSIWSGLALHHLFILPGIRKAIFSIALICQLIWLLAGGYIFSTITINSRWEQIGWYQQLARQVQKAASQGQVLSDDYLGMVVQAGQPVYYQPFELGQLFHAGMWDPTNLAEEIRAAHFSLILIGGDTLEKPCCWPPELVQAIKARYQIDYQSDVVICTPMP